MVTPGEIHRCCWRGFRRTPSRRRRRQSLRLLLVTSYPVWWRHFLTAVSRDRRHDSPSRSWLGRQLTTGDCDDGVRKLMQYCHSCGHKPGHRTGFINLVFLDCWMKQLKRNPKSKSEVIKFWKKNGYLRLFMPRRLFTFFRDNLIFKNYFLKIITKLSIERSMLQTLRAPESRT